jgi:hypothetical protein
MLSGFYRFPPKLALFFLLVTFSQCECGRLKGGAGTGKKDKSTKSTNHPTEKPSGEDTQKPDEVNISPNPPPPNKPKKDWPAGLSNFGPNLLEAKSQPFLAKIIRGLKEDPNNTDINLTLTYRILILAKTMLQRFIKR